MLFKRYLCNMSKMHLLSSCLKCGIHLAPILCTPGRVMQGTCNTTPRLHGFERTCLYCECYVQIIEHTCIQPIYLKIKILVFKSIIIFISILHENNMQVPEEHSDSSHLRLHFEGSTDTDIQE